MGLVVVARYWSLQEARIVCSALQSSGMYADVFDEHRGTVVWTQQLLLGGFRVVVSELDLEDAFAFLVETAPAPPPIERQGLRWSFLPLLALSFLWSMGLWAWAAWREGPTRWRTAGLILIVLPAWIAMLAVLAIAMFGAFFRHDVPYAY